MKEVGVTEVWFHAFLTLAIDGGKLSVSHYRISSLVVDPGVKKFLSLSLLQLRCPVFEFVEELLE